MNDGSGRGTGRLLGALLVMGLVAAIVVLSGLSGGRQVIEVRRTPGPAPPVPPPDPSGVRVAIAPNGITELTGLIGTHKHGKEMAFSPDGKTLALARPLDGGVELWELGTGRRRVLTPASKTRQFAHKLVFSQDARFLAVEHNSWEPEKNGITLWDLGSGAEQAELPTPHGGVLGMAFADDHRRLAMCLVTGAPGSAHTPFDHSAVLWDVPTGTLRKVVDLGRKARFAALSPEGRYAVIKYPPKDGGTVLFDMMKLERIRRFEAEGRCIFAEDGSILVSYYRGRITLREVPSGRELKRFVPAAPDLESSDHLSVPARRKLLAVGGLSEDHSVGVFSLETGKLLGTFECCPPGMICHEVCFSPDGRILATDTSAADHKDRNVDPILKLWSIPDSW